VGAGVVGGIVGGCVGGGATGVAPGIALDKSSIPAPYLLFQPDGTLMYPAKFLLTAAGLILGFAILYIATAAATCGAAIDVPERSALE
jgi:hypothetical protein